MLILFFDDSYKLIVTADSLANDNSNISEQFGHNSLLVIIFQAVSL